MRNYFILLLTILCISWHTHAIDLFESNSFDQLPVDSKKSRFYKRHPNWQFIHLSPKLQLKGVVHTGDNDKEYITYIFRKILAIAHNRGHHFYTNGNKKEYIAFLTAFLQIPLHESNLMNFRTGVPSSDRNCNTITNNGKRLLLKKKGNHLIKAPFKKYHLYKNIFNSTSNTVAPGCSESRKDNTNAQLLANGLLEDVSLMQLNFFAHEDFFISRGFLDTTKTIEYGVDHVTKHFKKLFENNEKYPCLRKEDGSIDYYNLVRSIWAGKYNGGRTCRFEKKNRFSINDVRFSENFNRLLFEKDSPYHKNLEGEDLEALNYIIDTFKSISFKKYQLNETTINIRRDRWYPTSGKLNISDSSTSIINNKCGQINSKKQDIFHIKHIDKDGWARLLTYDIKKQLKHHQKAYDNKYCYLSVGGIPYFQKRYYIKIGDDLNIIDDEIDDNIIIPQLLLDIYSSTSLSSDEKKEFSRYVNGSKNEYLIIRGTTSSDLTNIRKSPVCGMLKDPKGKLPFDIYGIKEDKRGKKWLDIRIDRDSKWISSKANGCQEADHFFVYKDHTRAVTEMTIISKIFRRTGKTARTYQYPNSKSKILPPLKKGIKYSVYETKSNGSNDWYRLSLKEERPQRWVNSNYITILEDR